MQNEPATATTDDSAVPETQPDASQELNDVVVSVGDVMNIPDTQHDEAVHIDNVVLVSDAPVLKYCAIIENTPRNCSCHHIMHQLRFRTMLQVKTLFFSLRWPHTTRTTITRMPLHRR